MFDLLRRLSRLGFPDYQEHTHIEWGTLRCNFIAFGLVALVASNFIRGEREELVLGKLVGSFCGALSAFGSTTDDTVRLYRHAKFRAATANAALNFLVPVIMTLIIVQL